MNEYDEMEFEGEVDLSEIEGPVSSEFRPMAVDEGVIDADEFDGTVDSIDAPQHMLLSYLNSNHKLWIRCAPIIEPSYFDKDLRPVVEMMQSFESQNAKMPHRIVVNADTNIALEEPDDAHDPNVEEFISDRVEEFCRTRAAEEFLWETSELLESDRTRATMAHLVDQMGKIAAMTVKQDLGYEVHRDAEKLLAIAEDSDALPTDFPFLDEALNGGVTCPSLNLISASSGGGKSIMLQNLAVNYARQGFNVIVITLELAEFMIEKRMAAMMTDTDINQLYTHMSSVVNKLRRDARKDGKIQIKRMKMNGTTVADIRAYVAEMVADSGEAWDHIIIDYIDLLSPTTPDIRRDNIHLRDQTVAVELYDWTHEPGRNKTVWTASQQTKGAKEEKDARQSAVSGGVGKVNTADNLIVMKRSNEDVQEERVWVFVEKGRNGGTGTRMPFRWDGKTQRLSTPDSLRELYEEANTPGARESEKKKQSGRFSNDPVMRDKTESAATSTPAQRDVSNKIRSRMNRGKKT